MGSLSQPYQRQYEGVRRDSSLLRKGFRQAKKYGDIGGALKLAQMGDKMGIAVGRTSNDRFLEGAGRQRYQDNMEIAGEAPPPESALDAYDFRQSQDRPAPRSRLETYRQAWRGAKTQEEKDAIVEQGQADGIPLSPQGVQALSRRRSLASSGTSGLQRPTAPSAPTEPLLPAPQLAGPAQAGDPQMAGPIQGAMGDAALEDRFAQGLPLSLEQRGRLSRLPSMRNTSLGGGQAGSTGQAGATAMPSGPVGAQSEMGLPAVGVTLSGPEQRFRSALNSPTARANRLRATGSEAPLSDQGSGEYAPNGDFYGTGTPSLTRLRRNRMNSRL